MTWFLMGLPTLLLILGGGLLGGRTGALIALLLSVAMVFAIYRFGDRMAIAMSGAVPVTETEAPELYTITRTLCRRTYLPVPRLYLIPHPQPNAFAIGRSAEDATVAVTEGLLLMLERHEVEGVIAHELAHIKNADILLSSVTAALVGALTRPSILIRRALRRDQGMSSDSRGRASTLPAAAMLHLAVPIDREYQADAAAVRMIASPLSLANALRKLADATRTIPMAVNPALSHLFIAQPAHHTLPYSTHPPIEERIRRLEATS